MLSARELIVNQLPSQANTWVNRHPTYTHAMAWHQARSSPVNEVTSEGLPRLIIKGLPPSYDVDLKIERPEIYYGEKTDEYVLVRTKTKEFDYHKGDKNVYTPYQGRGGVSVKTFVRRLLFSLEFGDPQILFTSYLKPGSKIMNSSPVMILGKGPIVEYFLSNWIPLHKEFRILHIHIPVPFPKNIPLTSTTELNNTCKVSGLNANYHSVASLLLHCRYRNRKIRICRRFENGKISNH